MSESVCGGDVTVSFKGDFSTKISSPFHFVFSLKRWVRAERDTEAEQIIFHRCLI